METKPTQEQLLKAVSDVLDEALAEYEKLQKSFDNIEQLDDKKGQGKGIVGDGEGPKPAMAKEDEKPMPVKEEQPEEKPEEKEDEKEEDEEKLMDTYKSVMAKMEKKGLLHKLHMKKSEAETLTKSVDERFETLSKAIKEVSEAVKKIGSQPAPRKGVTGYAPLKKSEEAPALKKSEVVAKLIELKKSGTNVDSLLINRIETGRLAKGDAEALKSFGIIE